jgi:hypothetical protein
MELTTLSTMIMIVCIAGLAYFIGAIRGYDKGAEDIKRIYEEYK